MKTLIEQLEKMQGAKFVSVTYRAKNTGELARYTLRMGVDYHNVCENDILELEIRLKSATGIEAICLQKQIDSLRESIAAKNEGREHKDYTKAGLYRSICPGVKVALNDQTFEIQGFQHSRSVIEPGEYKPKNYRSDETRIKDEIRKSLKVGNFRTLCLDAGNIKSVRLNGEEIVFE